MKLFACKRRKYFAFALILETRGQTDINKQKHCDEQIFVVQLLNVGFVSILMLILLPVVIVFSHFPSELLLCV